MAVLAVAFCPGPPILVPELAGGAAPELDSLRRACDAAVAEICAIARAGDVVGEGEAGDGGGGEGEGGGSDVGAASTAVVVVGGGPSSALVHASVGGSLRPWGADVPVGASTDSAEPLAARAESTLPLSLTIGAWLLDRAGVSLRRRLYQSVATGDPAPPWPVKAPEDDVVLLVIGDSSASRTVKAPRGFHPEAEGYDAAVSAAVRRGDPAQLAALDGPTAQVVGADGATAWRVAAEWWGPRPARVARIDAAEAPYGVGYLVGVWLR